ncbi:MAG: VanZ family protein [Verrucomicrobiaceae bacterium]
MPRFPDRIRTCGFWTCCLILWFIVLNLLSHGDKFHPSTNFFFGFEFAHIDKVVHFGYFFGGGGLFSAALYFRKDRLPWTKIILVVAVILSIVGIFDEWHQSFFANRTGNDPGDWLADTLGGFFGALVFRAVHRVLL